jgi:hypothetical protein
MACENGPQRPGSALQRTCGPGGRLGRHRSAGRASRPALVRKTVGVAALRGSCRLPVRPIPWPVHCCRGPVALAVLVTFPAGEPCSRKLPPWQAVCGPEKFSAYSPWRMVSRPGAPFR